MKTKFHNFGDISEFRELEKFREIKHRQKTTRL